MIKPLSHPCLAVLLLAAVPFAAAGDVAQCLDCHEPAEDWQDMTTEEIFAFARDASIKRHADNEALSDEALQALIVELTEK